MADKKKIVAKDNGETSIEVGGADLSKNKMHYNDENVKLDSSKEV